jgi:hypothetical protein
MRKSTMLFSYTVLAFAFILIFIQCNKKKDACQSAICTQEFRSFQILTVNAQKNSIIPDAVRITDVVTNLPINTITQNTNNTFTIFSDADMFRINTINVAQSFTIEALINNVVKGTATVQFAKDCCHVIKISGADSLVVH